MYCRRKVILIKHGYCPARSSQADGCREDPLEPGEQQVAADIPLIGEIVIRTCSPEVSVNLKKLSAPAPVAGMNSSNAAELLQNPQIRRHRRGRSCGGHRYRRPVHDDVHARAVVLPVRRRRKAQIGFAIIVDVPGVDPPAP